MNYRKALDSHEMNTDTGQSSKSHSTKSSIRTVTCQSPTTGRLFETRLELNNSVKTKQIPLERCNIFRNSSSSEYASCNDLSADDDEINNDRELYEKQLNQPSPTDIKNEYITHRQRSLSRKRRQSDSPQRSTKQDKNNKRNSSKN